MQKVNENILSSSIHDPSGFLFQRDKTLYRQINLSYKESYYLFIKSNLYHNLLKEHLLIPHTETSIKGYSKQGCYKVIQPEYIPFISYPYEWCFSQLKDAALVTLRIQKIALESGMTLKDASAYNIQFHKGKPLLIDTLSFEKYKEGTPWVAYRQFCEQFLAPLVLMSSEDVRLNQLTKIYLEGIPLDLTSSLLPLKTKLRPSLFAHLHLHSLAQKHLTRHRFLKNPPSVSKIGLKGLIDNLENNIEKLSLPSRRSPWNDYYNKTNYPKKGVIAKKHIVSRFLNLLKPKIVWDLGANIGIYSKVAAQKNILTIAIDNDHTVVETCYLDNKKVGEKNILPLVIDITNPSASMGWNNQEQRSLIERGPADTILALALLHHLAITHNLPFANIARFFSQAGRSLIIEFIQKEDSQVQKLLTTRDDIFNTYTQGNFEKEFLVYFSIRDKIPIPTSLRTIYVMEKRNK